MNWLPLQRIIMPVAIGFILDLLLGDPKWLYHPVRLVGKLIEGLEKLLRSLFPETPRGELIAGVFLGLLTAEITAVIALGLCMGAEKIAWWLGMIIRSLLCYLLFAVRSLKDESMCVYERLRKRDLPGARKAVSMIVGRDTGELDAEGVARAAVETVAENTSDGIIAPLLFMVIGGPVLGWFYKAVNTMDSMVGYRDGGYLYFGRFAARLDDVLNFIPARITALFMLLSCGIAKLDSKNARRIFGRDRHNHESPNAGLPEAIMAGALHVQLGGSASYFGKLHKKKTIGDDERPVEPKDIKRANRLMFVTAVMGVVVLLLIRVLIYVLI